ncbi:6-phosphofructokinase [Clostridium sp.]|uniref:6-phosphofructokinase n=1 Tax=Clostridium sp. TaxID=1506 RepID=UPI0026DB2DE6|nr:6-phosphofructokinase [Clostridium sp.]MDO5038569.1 6-phosphofructokinase [Clostridium sp.]
MKIGILTSGGDAPGMNAVIRAIVKVSNNYGIETFGIKRGYTGLLNEEIKKIGEFDVDYISEAGGTILKTSRCPEFTTVEGRMKAIENLKKYNIDAVIVIGGDGSFQGANKLHELGVKVIGIPGTIDNDLEYTDYCIGFDTTLNTVLECISKIKDTDASHEKPTIVEVMGRYCGDLALYSAMAGGGDIISTPERKLSFEEIAQKLKKNIEKGKQDSIIIITERMYNIEDLQRYLEETLNIGVRNTVLGFIQRGGNPSAFDRVLASRMGIHAVELLRKNESGKAVGIQDNNMISVDICDVNKKRDIKESKYNLMELLL